MADENRVPEAFANARHEPETEPDTPAPEKPEKPEAEKTTSTRSTAASKPSGVPATHLLGWTVPVLALVAGVAVYQQSHVAAAVMFGVVFLVVAVMFVRVLLKKHGGTRRPGIGPSASPANRTSADRRFPWSRPRTATDHTRSGSPLSRLLHRKPSGTGPASRTNSTGRPPGTTTSSTGRSLLHPFRKPTTPSAMSDKTASTSTRSPSATATPTASRNPFRRSTSTDTSRTSTSTGGASRAPAGGRGRSWLSGWFAHDDTEPRSTPRRRNDQKDQDGKTKTRRWRRTPQDPQEEAATSGNAKEQRPAGKPRKRDAPRDQKTAEAPTTTAVESPEQRKRRREAERLVAKYGEPDEAGFFRLPDPGPKQKPPAPPKPPAKPPVERFDDFGFPLVAAPEPQVTQIRKDTKVAFDTTVYAQRVDLSSTETLVSTLDEVAQAARLDATTLDDEAQGLRREYAGLSEKERLHGNAETLLKEAARREEDAESRRGLAAAYEKQASELAAAKVA